MSDEEWRTFIKAPIARDKEVLIMFRGTIYRHEYDRFLEYANICRDVIPERPDWLDYGVPCDPKTGAA